MWDFLLGILASRVFWSVAFAYLVAHTAKFFIHRYRFEQWSYKPFFDTGGMPSSHTATTVALTTAIALESGPSMLFIACCIFTLIIIRDSYGVRKSVSDQAHIINALLSEMKIHKKAKIVLGHTPLQVAVGFVLGLAVPLTLYSFF